MPRPRKPLAAARIEGRDQHDKRRYAGRTEPKVDEGFGFPPDWMNEHQRAAWRTIAAEIPWLNGSHRALAEIACVVRARLIAGEEVGVHSLNLLRMCLSAMGATPADASKVKVPDEAAPDPADEFFED